MNGQSGMGWVLLLVGVIIAGVGLLLIFGPSLPWLGRLPGDIVIEKERFRFYFPLTTCLLLSLLATLALLLIRQFFK